MWSKLKNLFLSISSININIWPEGDYSEHMPKGFSADRIGEHWRNAGYYFKKTIHDYEKNDK